MWEAMGGTLVLERMSYYVNSLGSTCREEFSSCKSWHTVLLLGFLLLFKELAERASVRNTSHSYIHKYLESFSLVRISFLMQHLVFRPYRLMQACSPAFSQSYSSHSYNSFS